MPTAGLLPIANFGAEERGRPARIDAAVLARWSDQWLSLWRPPAWDWLPDAGAVAWLNTPAAAAEAAAAGLPLWGADPAVVTQVHDKAFALRHAPPGEPALVLDADGLTDAEEAIARIEAAIASWPAEDRGSATVKPRHGSSGRGTLAVVGGRVTHTQFAGSLPRLRRQGGVVVEPWRRRVADLSALFFVDPAGGVDPLGTLDVATTPNGRCTAWGGVTGHSGIDADQPAERLAAFVAAATAVARSAAAHGYWGPCGIDGFVYRTAAGERLRPVVEFNARFTFGIVALAQLRRAAGASLRWTLE